MIDLSRHWQEVYERKNEDEVSWYQARPALSLQLIENTGLSPQQAEIVDVGGGASLLVDHLLDAGYRNITVLDIADAALEKAKRRLGARAGQVNWICADLLHWTPPRRYDIWHDRAVFHFLTAPADRQRYVKALKQALKPDGHVIIATFAPDGPERCSGLPVQRHSPESIARELGEDFELLEAADEYHTTPAGRIQHFNYARLRRRNG